MQWLKDINNQWKLASNDILYTDFKENLKPTENLNIIKSDNNKPVIYIPTHNIHDVYEWFRIFKDSYLYSTNFDKNGFAIHGYFSKERGESIQGWFPNLVEVKATSSNTFKYFNDLFNYYRSSIDYIDTFTNISQLFIDNVEVLNEELVLLKHQYTETLTEYTVNATLSLNNKYYVNITPGDEIYFKIGGTALIRDDNNIYYTDTIISILSEVIGLNTYLVITTKNTILNPVLFTDRDNGIWSKTSYENTNGVYQYLNNTLSPIPEMDDKYKLYNQIVYTYQGLTNSNKEFYLRRIEDTSDPEYTLYPKFNDTHPLVYSEGDAYLIKCEIDYNLDVIKPAHPITAPPYDSTANAYRLLFLDNTMADKVLSTDADGIGTYKLVDSIGDDSMMNLGVSYLLPSATVGLSDIEFYKNDRYGYQNILSVINLDATVQPEYKFKHKLLPGYTNSYKIDFTTLNTLSVLDNVTSTKIEAYYLGALVPKFPAATFAANHLVNLTFTFFDAAKNKTYVALKEQFVINADTSDSSKITFTVTETFDENFINEFNTFNTLPNMVTMTVEAVNTYGTTDTSYVANTNVELLKAAINKTVIGEIYDLPYEIITGGQTYLKFNKIKQSHQAKWENHGASIYVTTGALTYHIDHIYSQYTRQYFKEYYTIDTFLGSYLDTFSNSVLDIAQMQDMAITYKNSLNDPLRFGIEGSNKKPGFGNIIYFGSALKEDIIDNIKPDTFITITPTVTLASDVWVSKIEWDEEQNLGIITTLSYIRIPQTNEVFSISLKKDIQYISMMLSSIFKKSINTIDAPNYSNWSVFKPDTASYAYGLLNYAYDSTTTDINTKIFENITGIVFKEYNEPRISFLKRDKNFLFGNGVIVYVDVASEYDENINVAPISIDGYTLQLGDYVLLKDQVLLYENGIYIFNGAGVPLVPYGSMDLSLYWQVRYGVVNVSKSFVIQYNLPKTPTTPVTFLPKFFTSKKDLRLTMKPVEIAKLGVDNKTQPWQKINSKYDSVELNENELNIQIGINNRRRIRFIDGLTENNIINNINGQGQYAWILDEDVIVEDAVVGCTQTSGPGTGTLIWYTGTWVEGVWVDGIWIQGTWESGTWLNGTWNSFPIQDYYYYVTYTNSNNNLLSTWKTGIWTNGTWNGGIIENIYWINGTFNNGVIQDNFYNNTVNTWLNGTFNNGVIKHILWYNGTFNGGDFEKGIWYSGTFIQLDPTIPARFGISSDSTTGNFHDRTIWYEGIFDGGEFWSGINIVNGLNTPSIHHNGTIWYSGEFRNGYFWGGSFITGVFKNSTWHEGVWFGGYYASSITDVSGSIKQLTINPAQYDEVLDLTPLLGYIANSKHRMNTYFQTAFQALATPTASNAFTYESFINEWDQMYDIPYIDLIYSAATNTTIDLVMSATTAVGTTYVAADPVNHVPDGRPFLCAVFQNSTFKNGVWLNGYMTNSLFDGGSFINGYMIDCTFGINFYP